DLEEYVLRAGAVEPDAAVAAEEAFVFPLDMGEVLGRRTAELHKALASPTGDPSFAVERVSQADVGNWVVEALDDLHSMLGRLERAGMGLREETAETVEAILADRATLLARIEAVASM